MGPMDPIVQPNRLLLWQGIEPTADVPADPSLLQLEEERRLEDSLFRHQSEGAQEFLRGQAESIASALLGSRTRLEFSLPEIINLPMDGEERFLPAEIPADFRKQSVGGFLSRFPLKDIRSAFRQRLSQLEDSMYPAVAVGVRLLRYAVVRHIVHDRISMEAETAVGGAEESLATVEGKFAGYRRLVDTLYQALSLAPYIFTEQEYQAKRMAVLGRLVPLGNRLGQLELEDIIWKINRRAEANDLNRGLWLSLPYFDDRALEMKLHEFEVIPPGRTLFAPAFVVLAARREQKAAEQNEALSPSTRMHLLAELIRLENAFDGRPDSFSRKGF
ncbi:MAG: hypothetical protein JW748_09660 [Anaerolineales bacterium]|nr:hypothetical protein [Anaerolineales bacterium]